MSNQLEGASAAVSKLAPAVSVGGITMFGIPLPDVVLIATLIYTGLQTYILIKDRWITPKIDKRHEHRIKLKEGDSGRKQ